MFTEPDFIRHATIKSTGDRVALWAETMADEAKLKGCAYARLSYEQDDWTFEAWLTQPNWETPIPFKAPERE